MSPPKVTASSNWPEKHQNNKATQKWAITKVKQVGFDTLTNCYLQLFFETANKKSGNRHWGHTGSGDYEHILEKYPILGGLCWTKAGWPSIISESIPRNRIGRPHLACVYKYIGGASRSEGSVETDKKKHCESAKLAWGMVLFHLVSIVLLETFGTEKYESTAN